MSQGKILIVDDEPGIREMVRLVAEGLGFNIFEAENGKEGLVLLSNETMDVVVTDLNMPEMDGHEFFAQIRSSGSLVPIIFLTGSGSRKDESTKMVEGAFDYLEKPFENDELRLLLKEAYKVSCKLREKTAAS